MPAPLRLKPGETLLLHPDDYANVESFLDQLQGVPIVKNNTVPKGTVYVFTTDQNLKTSKVNLQDLTKEAKSKPKRKTLWEWLLGKDS